MASKKIKVMLQAQGSKGRFLDLPQSATLRSALVAAKLDPETSKGSVTINGQAAELSDRLHANDYISVVPKVAGGR